MDMKNGNVIGNKKSFKFRINGNTTRKEEAAAPEATTTEWIMHEFSLLDCQDYVLCRIKRTQSSSSSSSALKRKMTTVVAPAVVGQPMMMAESAEDVHRLGKKPKSSDTTFTVTNSYFVSDENDMLRMDNSVPGFGLTAAMEAVVNSLEHFAVDHGFNVDVFGTEEKQSNSIIPAAAIDQQDAVNGSDNNDMECAAFLEVETGKEEEGQNNHNPAKIDQQSVAGVPNDDSMDVFAKFLEDVMETQEDDQNIIIPAKKIDQQAVAGGLDDNSMDFFAMFLEDVMEKQDDNQNNIIPAKNDQQAEAGTSGDHVMNESATLHEDHVSGKQEDGQTQNNIIPAATAEAGSDTGVFGYDKDFIQIFNAFPDDANDINDYIMDNWDFD